MNALETLIGGLREVCAGLPDRRTAPGSGGYPMADIGLSAFALFFMGSPSFLAHQRALMLGLLTRIGALLGLLMALNLWLGLYSEPNEWPWTFTARMLGAIGSSVMPVPISDRCSASNAASSLSNAARQGTAA